MAEYQVIARKWRPQCFSDVVGQEHVVRTLKNAISQNRTAHAYLFVGPRGVGKTTLARIFAKAMNCESPVGGEPCCKCRSCTAIMSESSLDIIEIDAASHNTAGDMRDLADEVMISPVSGRYKIYIIDEVHMLSKAAWNALLKTVEEPPAHVKFIFATTEVHQVLPTIISRCQRFDLLPIPTRQIAERLTLIADRENVRIEPAAVNAIARAAEGGMRDAQSLLDQMIAFFSMGDNAAITGEQVLSLFGLTDRNDLDSLLKAMLANQPGTVVSVINTLSRKGKNLETLFDDLLAALRGVRISAVLRNPGEILEDDPETIAYYRELAASAPANAVAVILENLAPVGRVLHDALNKQVYLETILLKAMREAHAVKLGDILARLNQLRTAGELKFLDQLPASAPAPAQATLPETAPVTQEAVQTPPVQPPAEPTEPEVPQKTPEPVENVQTATVAPEPYSARTLFDAAVSGSTGLASGKIFRQGTPESLADSILTAGYGMNVTAQDFAVLESELPSYQKLIQQITGDWSAGIVFKRVSTLEPIEPAPEPAVPQDTPAETAPPPPVPAEDEPEENDENDDETSGEPAAPAEMPIPDAVPADNIPAQGGDSVRHSVINDDPHAIEQAGKNPVVRDILDLFGGEVVDVHCK